MAEEETINEQPGDDGDPGAEANAPEESPDAAGSDGATGEAGAEAAPAGDASDEAPSDAEQLATDALEAARTAVAGLDADTGADPADPAGTPTTGEPASSPASTNGSAGSMMGAGAGANAGPAPFTPEQLTQLASIEGGEGIDILSDVDLKVKIELGRTRMLVEDVLKLSDGSVVELDKLAGDPVDIFVNDRHVARGEVLILNDNFCVRVSEILETTIEDR